MPAAEELNPSLERIIILWAERQAQIRIDESVQNMQILSELSRSGITIDGRIGGRIYDGLL
ncbi:MAG: hypothetical protein WCF23_01100 [Candidatus Nitrosopolaris sp.]